MENSPKNIIQNLYQFIDEHKIDIIKYNLKSSVYWKGQKAILTRKYKNFCGEVIEKEAIVCILHPMQYIRNAEIIQAGLFYVCDLKTRISIGGIDCYDLILIDERIELKDSILEL